MKKRIGIEVCHEGKVIYRFEYIGDRNKFADELKEGKYTSGKAIIFEGESGTILMPCNFFGKYLIKFKELE